MSLPTYSVTCNCGMTITGGSEAGTAGLLRRHFKDGPFHEAWAFSNGAMEKLYLEKQVEFIYAGKERV
jgi:hypothetical protein